jgi:hypothetical protein
MAKGGNGDVLAGIVGALLTQNRGRLGRGVTAAEVAAAGVLLHAAAGDLAAAELGEYGVLASDVIEKYRLNSSANVRRVKDALKKKEVLTFNEKDEPVILDPLFEYWVSNFYFEIR